MRAFLASRDVVTAAECTLGLAVVFSALFCLLAATLAVGVCKRGRLRADVGSVTCSMAQVAKGVGPLVEVAPCFNSSAIRPRNGLARLR